MTVFEGLVLLAFVALVLAAGRVAAGAAVSVRPAYALAAGWLVLHTAMLQLDFFGFNWTRSSLFFATAFLALGLAIGRRRAEDLVPSLATDQESVPEDRQNRRLGLGDLVAAVSVVALFWAALALKAPHSDFVYHWGVKARHFVEAQQIDRDLLSYSLPDHMHPDYPQGLPDLLAAEAFMQGRVAEGAWLAISAFLLLGIVLAARRCLCNVGADRTVVQCAVATVAASTAAFSIQYFQAGGPDLPLALAVTLGIASIAETAFRSAPGETRGVPLSADVRLGLAAALAAALKVEGVVFSGVLLLLWWMAPFGPFRGGRSLAERSVRLGATIGPWMLVVTPWLAMTVALDLWPARGGLADPSRLSEVLAVAVPQFFGRAWMGLDLVLILVPVFVVRRATRWMALPLLLQAAFYLWVYLSTPLDISRVVATTFPRLLLHLVPAAWLLAFIGLAQVTATRPGSATIPARV